MNNVFNYAFPAAQNELTAANSNLGQAGGYFSNIVSGNRATIRGAMSPEINAATAASDASKRNLDAFGTARGGGTGAANQQRDTSLQSTIDNMIAKARPEAASELGKIGAVEGNIGSNELGLGANVATNFTNLSGDSRVTSNAINQQTVQEVTGAIEAALMM